MARAPPLPAANRTSLISSWNERYQLIILCIILFRIVPSPSSAMLPVSCHSRAPKKGAEASSTASKSFWESSCCHPRTAASLARMCKPFYSSAMMHFNEHVIVWNPKRPSLIKSQNTSKPFSHGTRLYRVLSCLVPPHMHVPSTLSNWHQQARIQHGATLWIDPLSAAGQQGGCQCRLASPQVEKPACRKMGPLPL